MADTAIGQWAPTVSSRDLLIGDCLWGSAESGPLYITPCWNVDKHPRYRTTLWQTGMDIVGLSTARHARQGDVKEVCRSTVELTSKAGVDCNTGGSVTGDVRRLIDDKVRAGMRAEVAALARFGHTWIEHAALKDMS